MWGYVEVKVEGFFVQGGLYAVGCVDGDGDVQEVNRLLTGTYLPCEVVVVKLLLEVIPSSIIVGCRIEMAPDGEYIINVSFVINESG